jgi:hypothetical protein
MSDDALGGRAPERELLTGALDWYRAVAIRKVEDLSFEQATRVLTPSGLSPLGIVQHLAWVECVWFRWRFAAEDVPIFTGGSDNTVTFELRPGDVVESVVASYRDEADHARRIVAGAALDDVSTRESPMFGLVTLRWTLVHLIEETARHAGHLDIMREQLDGRTGD